MRRIISNKDINPAAIRNEITTRRYYGTNMKVRTNLHKFKESKVIWRIKRGSYPRMGFSYSSIYENNLNNSWARSDTIKILHGTSNNEKIYGYSHFRTEEFRPNLWYTDYDERDRLRKKWNYSDIVKKNLNYKYMMQGWHGINEELLSTRGYEGTIYKIQPCQLEIRYCDNQGEMKIIETSNYSSTVIYQLKGLPGILYPGMLLTRPVNKNTTGYKNALIKRKQKSSKNRIEKEGFDFLGI